LFHYLKIYALLDSINYKRLIEMLVKEHLESAEIDSDKLATPSSSIKLLLYKIISWKKRLN
jgi:hypothetical protein